MLFSEVVGQESLKIKLAGMVQSGKFPHAVLLAGPIGHGGLPLALALAQFLHCEAPQEGDSCGRCAACLKHQKLIHPDLFFTYPVIKPDNKRTPPVSADFIKPWRAAVTENPYLTYNDWMQQLGAENKQGNITADECRQIVLHFNLKTFESVYKIQIIWMAEYLGNEGNILLKLIEEPPENTVFLLVAENLEWVLNTIISRTQIIKVPSLEDDALAAALRSRYEMDEATALKIARIAEGNYDTALTIAEGEENLNDRLLHEWLVACFNLKQKPSAANAKALADWVEAMAKTGRENQKIFIRYALFFLRECAQLVHRGTIEKLDGEELKFARGLSARLHYGQFDLLTQILSRMHYHIERNASAKILFMSNSFRIASVMKGDLVELEENLA